MDNESSELGKIISKWDEEAINMDPHACLRSTRSGPLGRWREHI